MILDEFVYYSPNLDMIKCLNTIYVFDKDVYVDMNWFHEETNESLICIPLIHYCGKYYITFDNTIKDANSYDDFIEKIYTQWINHERSPLMKKNTYFTFFVKANKKDLTSDYYENLFLKFNDDCVCGVLEDLTIFDKGITIINDKSNNNSTRE